MKDKLNQYQKPLIAAGLLGLLLVLYFYRHKIFAGLPGKTSPTPAINNGSNSTTSTSTDPILKMGSRGENVKKLQKLLNDTHKKHTPTFIPLLVEDGVFGTKTEQMLFKYTNQKSITLTQLIAKLAQS
ncbi:peptidoglycan-binding domain-containing protein [Aureispira anguillae]|uniref:Peptidoglycan binding-like domain-containing protein n=1 Tax=Aureispira anguillae TaxID=2864201 RepID=A0A915YG60_9BACT|nr:hypothetical protein [Aureispira anguillae]BDS12391.1 hypothetical protein AsAng_0031120 [Aureispira anguillae]